MCSILSRSVFNVGRHLYKSSNIFSCKLINHPRIKSNQSYSTSDKSNKLLNQDINEDDEKHNLAVGVKPEYQIFRDDDAEIILDVDEEKKRIDLETINAAQQITNPYEGINMKRGVNGVFEIEDLVEILRKDKAQNIYVATVPKELSYVDYIVIVTGKSRKHMSALATYIRKAYKLKRYPNDLLPKIEGANSHEWIAIDLGNIALHIFSTDTREKYDLETLWAVGSKYDSIMHNVVDFEKEFETRFSQYLSGLQPADELESNPKPVDELETNLKSVHDQVIAK